MQVADDGTVIRLIWICTTLWSQEKLRGCNGSNLSILDLGITLLKEFHFDAVERREQRTLARTTWTNNEKNVLVLKSKFVHFIEKPFSCLS